MGPLEKVVEAELTQLGNRRLPSFPGLFLYKTVSYDLRDKTIKNPQKAALIAVDIGLGVVLEVFRFAGVYGLYISLQYLS